MKSKIKKLFSKKINYNNDIERKTFYSHIIYSIIEGFVIGILALNEFVFIKSMKGSNLQVGFLFQAAVLVLVFSVLLNEWVSRTKNKAKLLRILGLTTRLPLIFIAFFPYNSVYVYNSSVYHILFLVIFFIYYSANPIIFPIINHILRTKYSNENFGKLYSYSTMVNKIVMLIVTFLFGLLLDFDNNAYIYIFPVIGVLGIISVFILSTISIENDKNIIIEQKSTLKSIKSSITNMYKILRLNKPFKDFQTGFMFYGFAFMGTVGVITIYFDKGLHLNYSSVAFYKNAYNIIAIILLPYFGRLIGRIDPRKFSAYTFASLLGYIFFIGITDFFPYNTNLFGIQIYPTLIIAIISNGFFAATMALLWYIGSAYFCKEDEAADYQAIHLTFTGLRSFFAPVLGVLFYELFGFFWTFMIGVILLMCSITIMIWSQKVRK